MVFCEECKECRICGNKNLVDLIDYGDQALTSIFPKQFDPSPPAAPMVLVKCDECGLVQIKHTVSSSELYTDNYGYRSGLNNTMISHLKGLVAEIEKLVTLETDDIIVDIGANDSTLLRQYKLGDKLCRIAIDPCGEQFKEYYPKDVTLVPNFFDKQAYARVAPVQKAKVVTSISMFYDLPAPQAFANDVASVLAEDGVWVMEQSYMPTMIKNLSFDTVCHEHLEYYTFKQITYIAQHARLRVINVTRNDCNGGSFRVFLTHANNTTYEANNEAIKALEREEHEAGWDTIKPYKAFERDCKHQRDMLMRFLKHQKSLGKTICIYGASTKGNTLLQYYGITRDLVRAIAERNPRKFGCKTPGTEIPITSEEVVRAMKPDFMLVLPWHFKTEFLEREREYLKNGGCFVFPLPQMQIIKGVQDTKKALVIGGHGQVGTYLTNALLAKGYNVFCMSRRSHKHVSHHVVNLQCDVVDDMEVVGDYIASILPDEIYNLAAVTESEESLNRAVYTHTLNSTFVTYLIECIKKQVKQIKLFQAGSIEVFKGNSGHIELDEASMHPTTPYGIAKLAAYWSVRIAREKHDIFACTGVFSNVESHLRRSSYVTKKIVEHFMTYSKSKVPLRLGNIDASCDWIHVQDVVDAILVMMQQDNPGDYIISSGELHTVGEFAQRAAKIILTYDAVWDKPSSRLIERSSGEVLAQANCEEFARSFEQGVGKKSYDNSKLKELGWMPRVSSLDAIIYDMCLAS